MGRKGSLHAKKYCCADGENNCRNFYDRRVINGTHISTTTETFLEFVMATLTSDMNLMDRNYWMAIWKISGKISGEQNLLLISVISPN